MRKTIFNLGLVLVISMLIFTSCKKDKNTSPVMEFINEAGYTYENTNIAPGDSIKVGFKCTWNGTDLLSGIVATFNDNTPQTSNFTQGEQTLAVESWLTKSAADEDVWIFELIDAAGNKSAPLTITLTKDLTLADVEDITGIVLNAQDNTTEKPMYSISNGTTYTFAQVGTDNAIQAKIDFVCYSDTKNGTHLASPGANWAGTTYETTFTSWTTLNESFFILDAPITTADYGILTKTKIKTMYDDIEAADQTLVKRKTKDMAAGKFYLLKTYDGKYGVIKVNSVETGTTGSVNFDIKIEK